MEKIIRWFVSNKVVSNLLMVLILVTGATTIPSLKMEVFPEIELNIISVTTVYPGATPSDVEQAICIKIEERLQGLDGVKKITSTASESVGTVTVEVIQGEDINDMLDKIKAEVDAIDSFPESIEKPVCRKFAGSNPVISVAVHGKLEDYILNELTENIKEEIDALPDITFTSIVADLETEIAIDIDESALRKYNLTFQQISNSIREWSLNIPSGSIETNEGEILIITSLFTPTIFFQFFLKDKNIKIYRFGKIKFSRSTNKELKNINIPGKPNRHKTKRFQWHKLHLFDQKLKIWDKIFYIDINMRIHFDIEPILKLNPKHIQIFILHS